MPAHDRWLKLRERAAREGEGLDPAARARVAVAVGERGPALLRRARRLRHAGRAGVVAAMGLAAVLVVVRGRRDRAPEPQVASAASVRASEPACAHWPDPSLGAARNFVAGPDGARVLDLGPLARAVASSPTVVELAESTRCRTVVGLQVGRVAIHAAALGGGELRVRHGETEVVVHGTSFAVSVEPGGMTVEVAEGQVGIDRTSREVARVAAGERALVGPDAVTKQPLPASAAQRLLDELRTERSVPQMEPAPAVRKAAAVHRPVGAPAAPSAPPAVELLAQADVLRRAGNLAAARPLYRRVAEGHDATAEGAWLALARLEMTAGRADAALAALIERARRFPAGALGPEAAWMAVEADRARSDVASARSRAGDLVRRWPASAQAAAARRWLADSGASQRP